MTIPFIPTETRPVWVFQNPGLGGALADGLTRLGEYQQGQQKLELGRMQMETARLQQQRMLQAVLAQQQEAAAAREAAERARVQAAADEAMIGNMLPNVSSGMIPVSDALAAVPQRLRAQADKTFREAAPKPESQEPLEFKVEGGTQELVGLGRNTGRVVRTGIKGEPPRPQVQVSVGTGGKGQSEYEKEIAKGEAAADLDLIKRADDAVATAPRFDALAADMARGVPLLGPGGGLRENLARGFATIFPGTSPDALRGKEGVTKAMAQVALQGIAEGPKLNPISNVDLAFLEQANSAQQKDTPETIERVASIALKIKAKTLQDAIGVEMARQEEGMFSPRSRARIARYQKEAQRYMENAAILEYQSMTRDRGRPKSAFVFERMPNGELVAVPRVRGVGE